MKDTDLTLWHMPGILLPISFLTFTPPDLHHLWLSASRNRSYFLVCSLANTTPLCCVEQQVTCPSSVMSLALEAQHVPTSQRLFVAETSTLFPLPPPFCLVQSFSSRLFSRYVARHFTTTLSSLNTFSAVWQCKKPRWFPLLSLLLSLPFSSRVRKNWGDSFTWHKAKALAFPRIMCYINSTWFQCFYETPSPRGFELWGFSTSSCCVSFPCLFYHIPACKRHLHEAHLKKQLQFQ